MTGEQHQLEPSLVAELFLIAIDPASGRLARRKRRRFRKVLARSARLSGPGAATRARRVAVRELRARGLIERSYLPGHYPLVPYSGATTPFGRLQRGIERGFKSAREIELFVLLSWSGVLAGRLSFSARQTARRRLRALLTAPPASLTVNETISPTADAIGRVVYVQEREIVEEVLSDLLSGQPIDVDVGGEAWSSGFDVGSGAGSDSGGGESSGGSH